MTTVWSAGWVATGWSAAAGLTPARDARQDVLIGLQPVTVVVPARNLTDPGNAPIGVQAVEHTRYGVTVQFFNKDNEPIDNAILRITDTVASQRIQPLAPG